MHLIMKRPGALESFYPNLVRFGWGGVGWGGGRWGVRGAVNVWLGGGGHVLTGFGIGPGGIGPSMIMFVSECCTNITD